MRDALKVLRDAGGAVDGWLAVCCPGDEHGAGDLSEDDRLADALCEVVDPCEVVCLLVGGGCCEEVSQ